MIPSYEVDADDLLKWARYLDKISKSTNIAIADALNDYGAGVVRRAAIVIARKGDLSPSEVMNWIEVKEATPRRLEWSMDASKFAPPSLDWSRPFGGRDTKQFEKQILVNIVTLHDKFVCEKCEEAAEKNPWTMAQIDVMKQQWKDWKPATGPAPGFHTNLIHPNCRCVITPFASKRRLPVTFGEHAAKEELFTARQLGERVAAELKVKIRAVKP